MVMINDRKKAVNVVVQRLLHIVVGIRGYLDDYDDDDDDDDDDGGGGDDGKVMIVVVPFECFYH